MPRLKRHLALPGLLACLLLSSGLTNGQVTKQPAPDAETLESLAHAERLSKAFAWSANRIRPSVVEIATGRRVRTGHPFYRRDAIVTGTGSGVIVDEGGFILTNHHVIKDVEGIVVSLHDGREFHARLVGADPMADLAVLKIEGNDLVAATFAPSGKLSIGQWVLAVGSPFGLELTVTAGIVSATGRRSLDFSSPHMYENYIQTDAAINPGSSGGPLVNLRGEVVGINTAIQTKDGGYLGIAFAIPVDMARNVVDSLVQTGSLVRPFLGITTLDLDNPIRHALGYEGDNGVIVYSVLENSPAYQAGILRADIITHLDNEPVLDMGLLSRTLALKQPGDQCQLTIYRDKKPVTIKVTLAPHPGNIPLSGQTRGKNWMND
ncbi:MAG: trypsin-like peptidase domain-containing protein [Phycisphaerales bacterium]|nr:trypsin-like peptidase domain-containing protein [Phycisphaerales bacterium]